MSIVGIILTLLVIGFVAWLLTTVPIPVHPWVKTAIIGILLFFVLVWILNQFGIDTGPFKTLHW